MRRVPSSQKVYIRTEIIVIKPATDGPGHAQSPAVHVSRQGNNREENIGKLVFGVVAAAVIGESAGSGL